MVLLLLTAIDQQGELRDFLCQLPDIDSGFDLLTTLAAEDCTLVRAQVMEQDSDSRWLSLPPQAFDGSPIAPILKELEKEWRQLLIKPLE